MFDIKHDIEIENAGGFFCEACLVGKPADEQSPDPCYCQGCYDLLNAEKKAELPKDYWTKDNNFYATGGKKWGVTKTGSTVCLEPVATGETLPDGDRVSPDKLEVVAKLEDEGNTPVGVLQHAGGRPRKEGKVHRVTEWRRKKEQEIQGVLI